MQDYRAVNRANWEQRAPAHASSPGYALDRFVEDNQHVSNVVRFDRPRLGDIRGLRGVHLQCHIGTDTVSLARLGARMTGLDFSPTALALARAFAERAHADVDFVESDVYDAPAVLEPASFDLVYTGIGALCWLPSIRAWADVVSRLLKPDGRLFIREGHPVLWALDEARTDDLLVLDYPYFECAQPLVQEDAGTYVETDATFTANTTMSWNHGLGEVVTAVLDAGMTVTTLQEHDSVPWEGLPGKMRRADNDEWKLIDRPERLPLSYTLVAVKN